jgi:hypothetical protein
MRFSCGKTKLRINVNIIIFNTYCLSTAKMVIRIRLNITLYYIGLPLTPMPVLWKANIYIEQQTVYMVCRIFLYLLLGILRSYFVTLICSFVVVWYCSFCHRGILFCCFTRVMSSFFWFMISWQAIFLFQ